MKKLLLSLLITLSATILAKTPESLFGVYINDNVLDYVTKEELKSKRKYIKGFYYLLLETPPVSNKDYLDSLFVMFDKNNKISNIQSEKTFQNLENCKNMEVSARRTLENKYDIEFVRNLNAQYAFQKWVRDYAIGTACKASSKDKIILYLYLETQEYSKKYSEYIDSKI